MRSGYITITRAAYDALVNEANRGVEFCNAASLLRLKLQKIEEQTKDNALRALLNDAISSCENVNRLRVEIYALQRHLADLDQEITPYRPASQQDIKAAFDNATDFATGKRKLPKPDGG